MKRGAEQPHHQHRPDSLPEGLKIDARDDDVVQVVVSLKSFSA
jgi:hypothetical protein